MVCFCIARLTELLGKGEFGKVYKAVWSHTEFGSDEVHLEEVAVKTLEEGSSEEDKIQFLHEAAIMGQFEHENIVKIKAVLVTESEVRTKLF